MNIHPLILSLGALVLLSGCSANTVTTNKKDLEMASSNAPAYSVVEKARLKNQDNVLVMVSFSGGGTRAAALSYGVLKGLRDTQYQGADEQHSMLDDVSVISSVSGGSFTSAYYGLYGDQIFERYEGEFLYRDVSEGLIDILLSPTYWFSAKDRSSAAANFYNTELFANSTFADIDPEGPMVIINATDLGGSVRFSFVQEYFDLICSDVNDYSVANAVAASSAVPFIFTPVVLENHDTCDNHYTSDSLNDTPANLKTTINGLSSYANKEERPYIHLIDGGITDNLGLLAIYDIVESQNKTFVELTKNIDTVIVISVDASTKPNWKIDQEKQTPSAKNMVGAITDIQLHRYNDFIKFLMEYKLNEWESQDESRMAKFIDINLSSADELHFMNAIPTHFTLEEKQVDALIKHGYQQLRSQISETQGSAK